MKQIEDKPKTRISKVLRVQARDVDILKFLDILKMLDLIVFFKVLILFDTSLLCKRDFN